MARGVAASRGSMWFAGLNSPSSRTSVAMSRLMLNCSIPWRRTQSVTTPGPPTAASSASVAGLDERVIMISMRSIAGMYCPSRTGARAEENLADRTGSSSGNSEVSE